jgi:hypothetical protein
MFSSFTPAKVQKNYRNYDVTNSFEMIQVSI